MATKLSAEEKEKILKLHKEGSSIASLAKSTGRSQSVISRIIKSSESENRDAADEESNAVEANAKEPADVPEKGGKHEAAGLILSAISKSGLGESDIQAFADSLEKIPKDELKDLSKLLEKRAKPQENAKKEKAENGEEKAQKMSNADIDYEYNIRYQQIMLSKDLMEAIGDTNANEALRVVRALASHDFDFRRFMRLSEILENFDEDNISLKEFIENHDMFSKLKEWGFDLTVLSHLSNVLGLEKTELRPLIDQFLKFNQQKARIEKYMVEKQNELDELKKLRGALISQISTLKGKRNVMAEEINDLEATIKDLLKEKETCLAEYGETLKYIEKREVETKDEIQDNSKYISEILSDLDKISGPADKEIPNRSEISEIIKIGDQPKPLDPDYSRSRQIVDIGFSIYETIMLRRVFLLFRNSS